MNNLSFVVCEYLQYCSVSSNLHFVLEYFHDDDDDDEKNKPQKAYVQKCHMIFYRNSDLQLKWHIKSVFCLDKPSG